MTADQFLHLKDGDRVRLCPSPRLVEMFPFEQATEGLVDVIDGETYVDGIYFPETEYGISEYGDWKLELP